MTRTGPPDLRADRTAAPACSASASATPSGRAPAAGCGSARSVAHPARAHRHRAQLLRRPGNWLSDSSSATSAGRADQRRHPADRRECSSRRSANSRSACPAGSQRSSACTTCQRRVRADDHGAVAAHQRRRVRPAPQRLLRRPQVGPDSNAQPSSSNAAPYPSGATGSAPGVATTSAGPAGMSASTAVAGAGPQHHPGKRPTQLFGRSRRARPPRPQRGAAARGQRQSAAGRPHQRQDGEPRRAARQRSAAVRAPGRLPVLGARQRRQVAAPGHLHQHRAALVQGGPGGAKGQRRQPGRSGHRVALQLHVLAQRHDAGCGLPQQRPVGRDRLRPAGLPQQAPPRQVSAKPPSSSAAPSIDERSTATSRACGYGARGSACRSSPSSQTTINPRSATGANTADRVPTHRPDRTARHRQPAPVTSLRTRVRP